MSYDLELTYNLEIGALRTDLEYWQRKLLGQGAYRPRKAVIHDKSGKPTRFEPMSEDEIQACIDARKQRIKLLEGYAAEAQAEYT